MKILLTALAALLAPALPGLASFTTNESATSALGQPDLDTMSFNGTLGAANLNAPTGCAVDPTTGKVFVADTSAHRVLRYASADAYTTGAAAEAVLGQGNFTSSNNATTRNGLDRPSALYVDKAGRLWVADTENGRVLRFDRAATKANGANADGVLGQPDFTSTRLSIFTATTANQTYNPGGLAGDAAGRLWVAEQSRNRVLRFDNAAAKANGANADAVLGQTSLTARFAGTSSSGLYLPQGLSLDSAGRLWVADSNNSRVLRFDSAATKANGADADGVLGQPDFTASNIGLTASALVNPYSVTAGPDGTVWISDSSNRRLIGFTNAASKTNGADADLLLGQSNFTSKQVSTGPSSLLFPVQAAFAGPNTLLVADPQGNRVARFGPVPTPTPAAKPTLTTAAKATARKGAVTLKGTSTNAARITYRVGSKGAFKPAAGSAAAWTIKLTKLAAGKTFKVTIIATTSGGQTTQTTVTVKSL